MAKIIVTKLIVRTSPEYGDNENEQLHELVADRLTILINKWEEELRREIDDTLRVEVIQ